MSNKSQGAAIVVGAIVVVTAFAWWAKGKARAATTTKGAPLPQNPAAQASKPATAPKA